MISYETAKRLKEKGFPQPEPKRGQCWFYEGVVQNNEGEPDKLMFLPHWLPNDRHITTMPGVYAPTATDILPHIFSYVLANDFENDAKGHAQLRFACYDPDTNRKWHYHADPDECVALAYLEQV
jgi:hypothetical protein